MAKAAKNQLNRKMSLKKVSRPAAVTCAASRAPFNRPIDMPMVASIEDARVHITDNFELPASYGVTNITLVARDPYWIYAYWDISEASFGEAMKELGLDFNHAKMTLRMYDVTRIDFNGENANSSFDLDVGHARSWYINLWKDNVSYCAEIGMKTLTGRFHSFARSKVSATPRANMSARREEVWMKVVDKEIKAPYAKYDIAQDRSVLAKETSPEIRSRRAKRIFLTGEDIKAYYYGLSPTLREIVMGRTKNGVRARDLKQEDLVLRSKSVSLTEIILGEKGASQRLLIGSSAWRTISEIAPGSSENMARGASEHMSEIRNRKFFFEIGTELIVYGRTEPDAMVLLGDKKVTLRPDGTFSMRFALPDGKVPLDFAAISGDRVERREITTQVERLKTQHNP